jgi:3-dehydroquinate synthase
MVLATDLSARAGLMPADFVERMQRIVERAGLPTVAPKLGLERYLQLMRVDKKSEGGAIRFVLIEALGRAGMHSVDDALVAQVLEVHCG